MSRSSDDNGEDVRYGACGYRLTILSMAECESFVTAATARSDAPADTATRMAASRRSVHSRAFCAALAAVERSSIGGKPIAHLGERGESLTRVDRLPLGDDNPAGWLSVLASEQGGLHVVDPPVDLGSVALAGPGDPWFRHGASVNKVDACCQQGIR